MYIEARFDSDELTNLLFEGDEEDLKQFAMQFMIALSSARKQSIFKLPNGLMIDIREVDENAIA